MRVCATCGGGGGGRGGGGEQGEGGGGRGGEGGVGTVGLRGRVDLFAVKAEISLILIILFGHHTHCRGVNIPTSRDDHLVKPKVADPLRREARDRPLRSKFRFPATPVLVRLR